MRRRRMLAEINVVPYIDVMLVLLVIFMVTAPMLMQGVEVDLPDAAAAPVDNQDAEPLIVSINGQGQLFLNLGVDEKQSLELTTIQQRVGAVLRRTPEKPVLIWGDKAVPYGQVVVVMTALQAAGAPSVGLVTEKMPASLNSQTQSRFKQHPLSVLAKA